jgi:membrane complex biogenesis BtpA family protein
VTDQGIIEGAARQAILYRRELGANVAIFADVFVKHAAQLGTGTIEDAARDAVYRGQADALIVTGAATGSGASAEDVQRIKTAMPDTRLLVGSGLNLENAAALMAYADGGIAGTSLKHDGIVSSVVDAERVRALREAVLGAA